MLLPIVERFRERLALRARWSRLRERSTGRGGLAPSSARRAAMDSVRRLVERVADVERDRAHPRRDRHAARSSSRARSTSRARAATSPSSPSTARRCPGRSSSRSLRPRARRLHRRRAPHRAASSSSRAAGTMLLDEIAEMPLELQAKLLRVLEDRRFRPLGAESERPLDVRIVAATHVDLAAPHRRGPLPRRPLLPPQRRHRCTCPSLAERGEDISAARGLLRRRLRRASCASPRTRWPGSSAGPWPGNVRELRNVDRAHRAARRERHDRRPDPRGAREPARRGRRAPRDRPDGPLAPGPARPARLQARRHRARDPASRHRVVRRQQERRGAPHRRRPQGARAAVGAAERRARRPPGRQSSGGRASRRRPPPTVARRAVWPVADSRARPQRRRPASAARGAIASGRDAEAHREQRDEAGRRAERDRDAAPRAASRAGSPAPSPRRARRRSRARRPTRRASTRPPPWRPPRRPRRERRRRSPGGR